MALGPRSAPGAPPSPSGASPDEEPPEKTAFASRGASRATRAAGIRAGIRQAGPLALAGLAANGANVVVTLLLARLLSTRGYGALAQLTSLFLVVSMPGTAVVVGVVRRVTALAVAGQGASVRRWARRAHARATGVVAVLVLVALAVSGPLAHALAIPSPLGVFAALAAGAVWVLLSFDRGLLQAGQAYRTLSVNLLVEGAIRTAAVLCFVGAGLGVAGAAWGMLVGELVTAVHARVASDRRWGLGTAPAIPGADRASSNGTSSNGASSNGTSPDGAVHDVLVGVRTRARAIRREGHRLVWDVSAALVAMALLAYLQNVDVIVLSREAPHASGPYAAISVASKALVFGAIALGGYLLPEAAIEWHRGGHALRQLGVTLLVLAVPGAALLLAAVAFPQKVLSLVFTARYVGAHDAFGILALAMVFLSATVIMTLYLLAAGQRWVGALLMAGALVATVALAAAHGAPSSTAAADLAVQGGLALATTGVFVLVHTRRSGRRLLERSPA